ncbi:MAG: MFS transporter [Elainellaceae cyanobacterium]
MPISTDQSTPPLSIWTKLTYGAGGIGSSATGSMLVFFFLFFLTDVAGLPAALAGSVLMLGQVSDAVSDPIIGLLSDRTQSRWGRRYPWIVLGALPFGLSFALLWLIPSTNPWVMFAYYATVGIAYKTALTAVYLPYVSLTPDLTRDYNERTRLNSVRFAFSIGSSILAIALGAFLFSTLDNVAARYWTLGIIGGALCILAAVVCVWGTYPRVQAAERQREKVTVPPRMPMLKQLQVVFSNRPFLLVMVIYLCSWVAAQLTATVMQYFVVSWMQLPSTTFTLFAIVVQTTALLMLFVWSWLSQRVGKRPVYFMGSGLWVIAQAGLFFLQPGQVGLMFVLGVMAGFGVSTAYLIPWSMLPDVIELDELQTGHRREGAFYAFMVMLQKVGVAAGLFVVGQALEWAGYIETVAGESAATQPQSALLVIRLAIGPVSALILCAGLVAAYFYPITQAVHAEIMLKLQERRNG